ncbi:alpha amylase C-terminal domain-containing protein [Streptomyces anulatus]|uniref:alpha amylase C-terminal domain-containing protein n=1 Tax=Streptomyces anulatus TaxID=1892 RepID=UPI00366483A8
MWSGAARASTYEGLWWKPPLRGAPLAPPPAAPAERLPTFTTTLPAGTYCNVVAAAPGSCDGNGTTVADDGTATITDPARGAVALHI